MNEQREHHPASAALPAPAPPWWRWFYFTALVYFAAKATYFALCISADTFPDEATHFGKSLIFARSFWPPSDSPDSYALGLITHVPNLYYWLMGRLLTLNVSPLPDLIFLRLSNVALAVATVVVAHRCVRNLGFGIRTQALFLVLMTNTLMFTFLAGAVSYDNLANLLAAASIGALFALLSSRQARLLGLFGVCLGLGALTKTSFLPLAALLIAVLAAHEWRRRHTIPAEVRAFVASASVGRMLVCVAATLPLVAAAVLYGGNLLTFAKLTPTLGQVIAEAQAMQNPIYARGRIVRQFRNGQIELDEAVQMTREIDNPAARQGALLLLRNVVADRARRSEPRLGRADYALRWSEMMLARVTGIMGHKTMIRTGNAMLPYYAVLLASLLLLIPNLRRRDRERFVFELGFIAAGYSLILMQIVNYASYERTGVIELALQGRYIFPVLAPLCALMAWSLTAPLRPRHQWVAVILVGAVYVYGGLPFFLRNATDAWFR